jgi:hypothetical protein
MDRTGRITFTLFAISFSSAVMAFLLHAKEVGTWLGAPALVLSGLAFVGHLITIDDDQPGGWANPGNDAKFWRSSLVELFVKFALFLASAVLLMSQW